MLLTSVKVLMRTTASRWVYTPAMSSMAVLHATGLQRGPVSVVEGTPQDGCLGPELGELCAGQICAALRHV